MDEQAFVSVQPLGRFVYAITVRYGVPGRYLVCPSRRYLVIGKRWARSKGRRLLRGHARQTARLATA